MIKSLCGSEPHPDYGGWEGFLNSQCEVRDSHDGVVFYGSSNCNYILFPCGSLFCNFGFHGRNVMEAIRKQGRDKVLEEIRDGYQKLHEVLYGNHQ